MDCYVIYVGPIEQMSVLVFGIQSSKDNSQYFFLFTRWQDARPACVRAPVFGSCRATWGYQGPEPRAGKTGYTPLSQHKQTLTPCYSYEGISL